MKILFLLLLLSLGIVLIIATIYHSNISGYTNNTDKNAVEPQIIRRRRTIRPATIHYCKFNQYYDQEEGRCLGVPGGGKVLHIENERSCGINVLKPHCKSSLYYHICKRDKSILAQCANMQIFDNRLQRCVYYDSSKLTPSIILPDDYTYYDHVRMPRCTRYGRFPVPGHCSMFYTCDTNGHQLHQSVFKCPQNTGYQVDRGVCNIVADCVNDNSVDTTVCVPDAPGENVESPRLDEDGTMKEISEILEQSKANADDPIVKKEEENVNFKTFDDIITTTPINIIGPLSKNNYNDNDNDTEVQSNNANSLNSIKKDLISEGSDEKIMYSQAPNQLETMQKGFDKGQNEEDGSSLLNLRITSPLTTELDDTSHSITEQYRNNDDSTVTPSNFNNDPVNLYSTPTISNAQESTPISDISPNTNEKMQDTVTTQYKNNEDSVVLPSNLNTDSIDLYSAPTINNVPESTPINDVSSNVDEKMQDVITQQNRNIEDSTMVPSNFNTDSVDQYTSTVTDVPESSLISDVSPNIDEQMQDAATKQHRNSEESIMTPTNFNTDSVDLYSAPTISNVSESSLISDVSPNVNEKMQDAITEQNRSNEDGTMTPSIFNTDSVDSAPTMSNIPESSPISDVLPNVDERMQDAITEQYKNNEDSTLTPSNFNTDSVAQYSTPTISNVQEFTPTSDVLPNINEKMQDAVTEQYKNNEDIVPPSNLNTDSVDLYSAPTMSNMPETSPISDVSPNVDEKMQDTITEQYRNNEDSTMTPSNFNTDSVDSVPTISNVPESSSISDVSPNADEKMQDPITEQNRNNEDSTITPSNFNTDSVDQYPAPIVSNVAESFPISDMPSKIDEGMQDEATEQYNRNIYRNNEDSTVTPSNFNTDSIDKYPAPTISNVPESSPISDVSPNIDEKMQDMITEEYKENEDIVMPSTLNTDTVDQYPASTVSNTAESSPISSTSSKIDEEMQHAGTEQSRNNEDSSLTPSNFNTDSIDSAPTISNVPESSSISDMSPNVDEKMQENAITEQNRNNENSTIMSLNFNTDSIDKYPAPTISNVPESSPISDVSPNIDEKMQDAITEEYKDNEDSIVTPSTLNTDTVDQYPALTVSNTAESSPISSTSSKIDEEMQDAGAKQSRNNEDSTLTPSNLNSDLVDLYSASTISNIPESSPISDVSPNLDERMKDAITEEYRNNGDSTVIPSNFNTDLVDKHPTPTVTDVSESSPIKDVLPNIDEKMQDAITEEYRNNEDSIVTPSNLNSDSVDQYPAPTISNVAKSSPISSMSSKIDEEMQDAATEQYRNEDSTSNFNTDSISDSPRYDDSNVLSSPSTLAILPSQE